MVFVHSEQRICLKTLISFIFIHSSDVWNEDNLLAPLHLAMPGKTEGVEKHVVNYLKVTASQQRLGKTLLN